MTEMKIQLELSRSWRTLGELDKARSLYERALKLYEKEQEPMGAAYTCAELARCHHIKNRVALAFKFRGFDGP